MLVFLPPELKSIESKIRIFFDAMIYKLRKNAHKGEWPDQNLQSTLKLLHMEVDELHEAIHENNQMEIILEAADVANFALILANIAIKGKNVQVPRKNARHSPKVGHRAKNKRTKRR